MKYPLIVTAAAISDTHGRHREVDIPKVNILFFAGDISSKGQKHQIEDFSLWLEELKTLKKIDEAVGIVGNHEITFDKNHFGYNKESESWLKNCHYLNDSSVEIMGLKIYGSPVTPWFYDWGFNIHRGEEIKVFWDKVPRNEVDVFITHGPPYGIQDWVETNSYDYNTGRPKREYVGCKDLLKAMPEINPTINIFGHIHGAHGNKKKQNIHYANVAICDEDYRATNPVTKLEFVKKDEHSKWTVKVNY